VGEARKLWVELGCDVSFRKFHTMMLPSDAAREDLVIGYLDKKLQGTDGPIQLSFGESDAYTTFNKV